MLESKHLISNVNSLESLLIAGDDHAFSVYFHDGYGNVDIATGTSLSQTIFTYPYPSDLLEHSLQQFIKISDSVNVQFEVVNSADHADISFYYDSEIVLDHSHDHNLGLTIFFSDYISGRKWIEIYFNAGILKTLPFDLQSYVFNHELLHALGFEHTFDNSDNDFYLSTNPLLSATPEETSMSYRSPVSGVYPIDLSMSDYHALQDIWGMKSLTSSVTNDILIYRLYSPTSNKHLFSSNLYEIDLLTGIDNNQAFVNEGLAYSVSRSAPDELFRFYNSKSDSHFYSANPDERDLLIANPASGFIYEGVAFNIFLDNPTQTLNPVIRYFDPLSMTHFFSASFVEQEILDYSHPHWINEGIAWYV